MSDAWCYVNLVCCICTAIILLFYFHSTFPNIHSCFIRGSIFFGLWLSQHVELQVSYSWVAIAHQTPYFRVFRTREALSHISQHWNHSEVIEGERRRTQHRVLHICTSSLLENRRGVDGTRSELGHRLCLPWSAYFPAARLSLSSSRNTPTSLRQELVYYIMATCSWFEEIAESKSSCTFFTKFTSCSTGCWTLLRRTQLHAQRRSWW